jgi:hypothetical protein
MTFGLAVAAWAAWPVGNAAAQGAQGADAGAPASPDAGAALQPFPGSAPATPPPSEETATPAGATPAEAAPEPFPGTVFSAPSGSTPAKKKRTKPLQSTVGLQPTAPDFGGEADLISSADDDTINVRPKKWTYSLRGFLRAPMRIGIGPLYTGADANELHSPPRIPGASSTDDWNYIGLAPNPAASLYLTVGNAYVTGTMIIAANTLYDSGYKDIINMGGFSQAYVTMRLPDLFGNRGGLSWNVGAFSNRYGTAGPKQISSGYYQTYLFGRTHISGEVLTADIDLSDDVELVLEHGVGAKLEVIGFISPLHTPPAPQAPYLPDQGPVAQGSNFVHHAHAALLFGDWMRVAGHFITSWSPNELCQPSSIPMYTCPNVTPEARMTISGGEIHLDPPRFGNLYLGYSHIKASHVMPLADGVQVLHSTTGYSFKNNYFGFFDPATYTPWSDSGTVDTVLFQYIFRLAPALGWPPGRDLALALFGMFNHVKYPFVMSAPPNDMPGGDVTQDRFKYGAEAEASINRFFSAGFRFDRVQPDGSNTSVAYTALSPRVIVHSNWLSKEYFVLDYTHFILGDGVVSGPTYLTSTAGAYQPLRPDHDMVVLTAVISF